MSAPLQNIGPVQPGRVNPDPNSIGRRRVRSRDFTHSDSFDSTV